MPSIVQMQGTIMELTKALKEHGCEYSRSTDKVEKLFLGKRELCALQDNFTSQQ